VLRATLDDAGRWCGHRTFHVDGSAFRMPDTPELQKKFGQADDVAEELAHGRERRGTRP